MSNVLFTVPGEPQGKARPRVTRHGTYTPSNTVAYERLIRACYHAAATQPMGLMSEYDVTIIAYYRIPASASKKARQRMLDGEIRPTKKPDCDNVIKVVCDSLNGIVWKDDAQVTHVACAKYYGAMPHLQIEIREIQRGDDHAQGEHT